jgi:hypothetical protein
MRMIERSSAFKRDYKRAMATPRHSKDVDSLVSTVVVLLLACGACLTKRTLLCRQRGCKNKTALECKAWPFRSIELARCSTCAADEGEGLCRQTIE